ncbi:hypothetical protein [Polyangium aurulentum]|uniref:hypothetical protein n=1 Tax=Polyangium aurulentum TaxID=2567896 RepID=UPI00146A1CA4|nr:hypothetical protein [Polyangium aurulentum]UQA56293.1 hypothetical protein E8A73_033995 [Polyangium aurulentum]
MGTLVCTVELNKKTGVKVTINDDSAGMTQTIAMDGKTVTITVAKGSDTSSITQDEKSVVIKCKTFEVQADEAIKLTSSGTAAYESTKDTTIDATADVKISGQNVKATGQTAANLAGAQSKLDLGASGAALSSPQKASVSGQMQTSVSGTMVEVKADGMLTAEATGVATFKGAVTNVQGNLVNLG